jgi:hypothetical protein
VEAIIWFNISKMHDDLKPFNDISGSHHVLKDVYSFFNENITGSVCILVGCPDWKLDLQIINNYSIPALICDPLKDNVELSEELTKGLSDVMNWIKFLKLNKCGHHFINPKLVKYVEEYPGNFDGTIKLNRDVTLTSWANLLQTAGKLLNIPELDEPRFAICKIDVYDKEVEILASLLSSVYRPSLIYVKWTASPDESQRHCESAGHLQTVGYRLISVNTNGFFLYQYSGDDVYSCCSWITPSDTHPFIQLICDEVQKNKNLI